MEKIHSFLAMFPWWRHRQCERGGRPCWDCRTYPAFFARARGGLPRDQWLIEQQRERRERLARKREAVA